MNDADEQITCPICMGLAAGDKTMKFLARYGLLANKMPEMWKKAKQ